MSTRLLVACTPGEFRIEAAASDDTLQDFAIWRPGRTDGVGDIRCGRIDAVLPALGGAFVSLGPPDAEVGFLPLRDNGAGLGEGMLICVRVVRSAQGGKGPRLALVPSPPGPLAAIGRLQRGPDPLVRLAAAYPDAPILCDDPALLSAPETMLPPELRARIARQRTPWPPAIDAQAEALGDTEIALPGGMRASIHPTPALVAIDVDGGASSAGRGAKPVAQFAANRAAIGPLLHQLRLRDLGGAILIDLAGLASRKRAARRPEIAAALARDPGQPKLLGFTALGLVEIVRPRIHAPLHERLGSAHAAALRALAAAARVVDVPPHRLPGLVLGLEVAAALDADDFARDALARRAGRPISTRIDPALPRLGWRLDHG